MHKQIISLEGVWKVIPGEKNEGKEYEIHLPGTLDEAGIGEEFCEVDIWRLNRVKKYVGPAWYTTKFKLDYVSANRHVELFLERCMWRSDVWINGEYAGCEDSLCTPHVYNLDGKVQSGENVLVIRVDNSMQYNLGKMSHGYSEEVQTRWNGIIGTVCLLIKENVYLDNLQIFPDIHNHKIDFCVDIRNQSPAEIQTTLNCRIVDKKTGLIEKQQVFPIKIRSGEKKSFEHEIKQLNKLRKWDDFDPCLYRMQITMGEYDSLEEDFGMREFLCREVQFQLNGNKVFLRGTHDAGNFPLTGYPSMNRDEWRRIYEIGKSYGLNHFRFHSWCPGEAGFAAADEAGIILQAELPLFGFSAPPLGEDPERDKFLFRELKRILKYYGNHPSFCMMCMGNELRGDYQILEKFVQYGKQTDRRHIYTTAANNAAEPAMQIRPDREDEFFVAHEARVDGQRILRRGENVFNQEVPSTVEDYGYTLKDVKIPVVSHEVGQWEVYPDYEEIGKYTGVLHPENLKTFRKSMEEKGLLYKNKDFAQASGKLAVELYREEIEKSLRTPFYGGFQLLDLHDFPGQGTALVGILDAFWESKGLISPDSFREFCNHTVLLARMEKRVWTNEEQFCARIDLVNYSKFSYDQVKIRWRLSSDNVTFGEGSFLVDTVEQGSVTTAGEIKVFLNKIKCAEKLMLTLEMNEYEIVNHYIIWCYPAEITSVFDQQLYISHSWDKRVEEELTAGKTVLLLTGHVNASEPMRFTNPFWNTVMFDDQRKTMGMQINSDHPLFELFPTETYTNWQWWELTADSSCIRMNSLPDSIEPAAWVIDHPVRNDRLGIIFEAKAGMGRLFVCSVDIESDLEKRPVAKQLAYCISRYISSDAFAPRTEVSFDVLREMLTEIQTTNLKRLAENIEASNTKWSSSPEYILEKDESLVWTTFGGEYPYTIDIELKERTGLKGLVYVPRRDGLDIGKIAKYEIYVSDDKENWGIPVARGEFLPGNQEQICEFDWMDDGFNVTRTKSGKFIRFVALEGFEGDHEASISHLEVLTV